MGSAVVYATPTDLANWLGASAPDNATALLRSASFTVALACQRDPYNDNPVGEAVDALRDATCAQAALWLALGVNPDMGGLDVKVIKSSKLGSGSVEFDQLTAAQVQSAISKLAPTAVAILTAANLIWAPVPVGAEFDHLDTFGLSVPVGRRWGNDEGDCVGLPSGIFIADGSIIDGGTP